MNLSTVNEIARIALVAWYPMTLITLIGGPERFPTVARIYRRVCPVVALVIIARMISSPSWGDELWAASWFISWWVGHRFICRHDHTRRLRDAATGLVQRVGSRLRVAPVGAR